MKKILFFCAFFVALIVDAQIEVKQETISDISVKLDSTVNVIKYTKAGQFLGLVNHELYGFPLNKNYDFRYLSSFDILYQTPIKHKSSNGKVYKSGDFMPLEKNDYDRLVSGKYFIVKEIEFKVSGKISSPEKWEQENKHSSFPQGTTLSIIEKNSNQKFIISQNAYEYFLSVPYFEYLKNRYQDKEILNNEYSQYSIKSENLHLINPKAIDQNDILKVENINIVQSDSDSSRFPDIKFNLKDKNGNLKYMYDDYLLPRLSIKSHPLLKEYESFLINVENASAINKKEYEKKYARISEEFEKKKDEEIKRLTKKYGKAKAEKIYYHDLEPGMTITMMFDSFKGIVYKDHTETKIGTSLYDSYVYESAGKTYLITLKNNIIESISKY